MTRRTAQKLLLLGVLWHWRRGSKRKHLRRRICNSLALAFWNFEFANCRRIATLAGCSASQLVFFDNEPGVQGVQDGLVAHSGTDPSYSFIHYLYILVHHTESQVFGLATLQHRIWASGIFHYALHWCIDSFIGCTPADNLRQTSVPALSRLQHCQDAADFGTTAVSSPSVKPSKAAIWFDESNRDASKIKVWWNFSPCLPHANCLTPCLLFFYLLLVFTTESSFTFESCLHCQCFPYSNSGFAQMAWLLNLGRLQFRAKQSWHSNATNAMCKMTKLSRGRELSSPRLYHQSKAVAKKKKFFKVTFECFWTLGKLPDVALAVCLGF